MRRLTTAGLFVLFPIISGCVSHIKEHVKKGDLVWVEASLPSSNYRTSSDLTGDACLYNQPAVLKLLVEKGAKIEGSWDMPSALDMCVRTDRHEMMRYLFAKGAAITPMVRGSARKPETMAILLAEIARRENPTATSAAVEKEQRPGNLDDAAYDRMRASAGMAPEKRSITSDVDAPARRGTDRPNDFALVIGIEDYQSLPKAEYGVRDAQTVRKHLEALGFPPRNIISLEGPQATASKLKSYLEEWLPLNVKPESTLVVYYSGHGAPDPKTGDAYLVPWDGDPAFLKSSAYPLSKFYADLGKTKAKKILVALDACFSGAGGRSVLAQGARPLVAKVTETPAGARVTVLAAASGEEITGSLNEQGHGMFTYFLLKALSDGKRTAREVHDYLAPRVQDEARRQNRQQSPQLIGDDAPF